MNTAWGRNRLGHDERGRRTRAAPAALVVALAVMLASFAAGPATEVARATSEGDGAALPALSAPWGTYDPTAVLPAPGTPLSGIQRDCAFSVELSDRSALWIFCDSTDAGPEDTELTYFVNNTAALATSNEPLVVRDVPDTNGRPYRFVSPTPAYAPCTAEERHVIWPLSATRVAGPAGIDRVLVYFHNICQHRTTFVRRDMSTGVARWDHDASVPLGTRLATPVQATVITANLFPTAANWRLWGSGAVNGNDGFVYIQACKIGGCTVARAPVGEVGTAGAYRYWNGSDWTTTRPSGPTSAYTDHAPFADPHVVWVPAMGHFAMADRVGTNGVGVWIAERPEGPWSPRLHLTFPHCAHAPRHCYHGTVHSHLSDADVLAVGLHDSKRLVNGRWVTRNMLAQVPVTLDPPLPGVCQSPFPDVRHANPFCEEIAWFLSTGITTGYGDGTFRPSLGVQRMAMAAFLYRFAGEPSFDPPAVATFSDVSTAHPFHHEIEWLATTDITRGWPDGTFRPAEPISRMAMAAFLARFVGAPDFDPPPVATFSDVNTAHPFHHEIEWLATTGVTQGWPDGTFRPGEPISRMAMAAFLYRLDALAG